MDITLLGGTSAVVIIGIVIAVVKKAEIPTKYLPAISLLIGAIVVCLGTWSISVQGVLTGIILGALTSGVYDNVDKGLQIAGLGKK